MELTRPERSKPALVPVRVSPLVPFPALFTLVVWPGADVTLFPPAGRFTVPGVFARGAAPVRVAVVLPVVLVVLAAPVLVLFAAPRLAVAAEFVVPRPLALAPPCAAPPFTFV